MADVNLSSEVKDVLSRATIKGNNLYLSDGQLERGLYQAVDKALRNMGGKWVTKARAHVFTSDPLTKLKEALGSGIVVDKKKLYQAFYTPNDLAARLARIADVAGKRVLEPEAGRGAIALACRTAGAKEVVCVEANSECVTHLWSLGFETTQADFLELDPDPFFDCVVMNPPFAKNQDIAHVERAIQWLRPDGVVVAIMLDNQKRPGFQNLISRLINVEIEELPRGTFKESGTPIATLILTGQGLVIVD